MTATCPICRRALTDPYDCAQLGYCCRACHADREEELLGECEMCAEEAREEAAYDRAEADREE